MQGIWVLVFFQEIVGTSELPFDMTVCVASPRVKDYYAAVHMRFTSLAFVW